MRLFFVLLTFLIASLNFAQSEGSSACIDCHSDESLTMDRNGKEISLFVNADHYKKSVHQDLKCIDCHTGFDADEIPHKQGNNISQVNCLDCHSGDDIQKSVHKPEKVECFSCHNKHEIQPAENFVNNEIDFCLKCHQTSAVKSYKKSVHFTQFVRNQKAPSCLDCHNNSAHNVQQANFTKEQEDKLCSTCHKSSHDEFAQSIHGMAAGPNTPGCVSCHGAHEVYNSKFSISSQSCLKCHLDQEKFKNHDLTDFVKNYQTSVHARVGTGDKEAATCVDCHDNHMIMGMSATKSLTARQNIPNTCGKCHNEVLTEYKNSSHGIQFIKSPNLAPNCTDCHGEHNITSIEKSPLSKLEVHKVCNDCHAKNPEIVKLTKVKPEELLNYESSVHFQALINGNENAATCSDCHGSHTMQSVNVDSSRINRENVSKTCGEVEGCHQEVSQVFMESIHGKAVSEGKMDAPTCVDCHGNHQVYSKDDPKSKVGGAQKVVLLCNSCHADVKMAENNDLPIDKAESYLESYHGLAVRGGSQFAADCASCHGSHNIRPSSDPASMIHENNLNETCGSCHPGASITGDFKKVHVTYSKEESPLLYYIGLIYIFLIVAIIGFMLVHNILDLFRKLQEKKKHAKEIHELKKSGKVYLRMSKNERIQHFIMLTSFISLVITGFALKYPDAWWVVGARTVLGSGAFEIRSILHRVFGISMAAVSIYHMLYLAFTKRGRRFFLDMLPNLKDAKDFIVNIKFLFGISKQKPLFDRFTYMEKAEYWALVWGVIIMTATGLLLMFNNYFLQFAPKIFFDVATIVHLYEAWLATLAIIVWHFYFVIFNPEVYPLNKAFITGYMSEEEMKHEHPLELERIKKEEESKRNSDKS